MGTLLIRNIKTLIQTNDLTAPLKGQAMADLAYINDAYLLIEGDRIIAFGPNAEAPKKADEIIDATGRLVLPAWCDSHSHIVFAGDRVGEYVDKINGLTYEEIAQRGGGILNSARLLKETSEDELYHSALKRLKEMVAAGTGALEIKSGYGLSLESEIKMLRVVKRLKQNTPVTIKATFLGAHAIPQEYKQDRAGYIKLIVDKMLPAVAEENLADYCDVFCDKGFFTPDETDVILKAAARFGLPPKIHANELDFSGGVQVGVANGARSVDHLEYVAETEIKALLSSDVMPTLLPSTSFFLRIPYAPARTMLANGLPLALATDYNPGSSPSGNMPFVLALACNYLRLTPEEAINAATINGAYAMDVLPELGSIAVGKKANVMLTHPLTSYAAIPYAFGVNPVATTILNGKIVYRANDAYAFFDD